MWPAFGILAVYFWWMLVHTDYDSVGLEGHAAPAGGRAPMRPGPPRRFPPTPQSRRPLADDDPELAAYNARLAELAAQGPKTWRARESVVVRRER